MMMMMIVNHGTKTVTFPMFKEVLQRDRSGDQAPPDVTVLPGRDALLARDRLHPFAHREEQSLE